MGMAGWGLGFKVGELGFEFRVYINPEEPTFLRTYIRKS